MNIEKAKLLERRALEICDSSEEAIAALSIAMHLVTRGASQYDVLKGEHVDDRN